MGLALIASCYVVFGIWLLSDDKFEFFRAGLFLSLLNLPIVVCWDFCFIVWVFFPLPP